MGNVIPNVALSNKRPNVYSKTVTRDGLVIDGSDPSLVAGYEMEINPADTVKDVTGTYDGITVGTPDNESHPIGKCINFSDAGSAFKGSAIPELSKAQDYTFAMWFNINNSGSNTVFFGNLVAADDRLSCKMLSGKINMGTYNGSVWSSMQTDSTIELNKWNHLAFTRTSAGAMVLYINNQVQSATYSSQISAGTGAGYVFGAHGDTLLDNVKGCIGPSVAHSSIKSPAWVAQQYRDGLALL